VEEVIGGGSHIQREERGEKNERKMRMREDEDERVKRRHHTHHPRDPKSFIKKLPEVLRVEEDEKRMLQAAVAYSAGIPYIYLQLQTKQASKK